MKEIAACNPYAQDACNLGARFNQRSRKTLLCCEPHANLELDKTKVTIEVYLKASKDFFNIFEMLSKTKTFSF